MPAEIPRGTALVAALALAIAPPAAQAALAQAVKANCPDPATVQAARVVEFQTMMMGVSVRCKHVGVVISDHLDQMTSARRTMLTSANDRVASYVRGMKADPAPPPAPLAAPAPSPAPVAKGPPAKAALGKAPLGKPRAGRAAAGQAPAGRTRAVAKPALAATAAAATTAPAKPVAKPGAKISRRTDPFDRYLTMIGNQYGAGMTTLQRCKAFDAIVMSLADKTNTDRLLTMVSGSLVQATLLEAIVSCPAGRK